MTLTAEQNKVREGRITAIRKAKERAVKGIQKLEARIRDHKDMILKLDEEETWIIDHYEELEGA